MINLFSENQQMRKEKGFLSQMKKNGCWKKLKYLRRKWHSDYMTGKLYLQSHQAETEGCLSEKWQQLMIDNMINPYSENQQMKKEKGFLSQMKKNGCWKKYLRRKWHSDYMTGKLYLQSHQAETEGCLSEKWQQLMIDNMINPYSENQQMKKEKGFLSQMKKNGCWKKYLRRKWHSDYMTG